MELTERIRRAAEAAGTPPVIQMNGIIKRYYEGKENELEILHGIDLTVRQGDFVAIVGESGSGKSTLMNIIGALDKPTSGTYLLDGTNVQAMPDSQLSVIRNKKIGFVFQNFNLIGRTSALKNVELPMLYAHVPPRQRTQRAKELLERTVLTISEIAIETGYSNTAYFTKMFKKYTNGVTPREYRKGLGG